MCSIQTTWYWLEEQSDVIGWSAVKVGAKNECVLFESQIQIRLLFNYNSSVQNLKKKTNIPL